MPLVQASAGPNVRGEVVLAAALMMGVAGLVLVIACGNVASLLLARATRRRQEIAMRVSLGASRGRLVRQLLGESLLLAAAAGILGVLCAYASRYLMGLFLPGAANAGLNVRLDMRVLLFTLGVSALATVLFGLIPVLQVLKPDRLLNLRSRQSAPGGTRWHGMRGVLVVTQVALSLMALVGAGLFIRSLRNAYRVNPGFDAKRLVVVALDLSAQHYTRAEAAGFCRMVLEQVRGLPAVESASFADARPLGGSPAYTAFPDGQRASDQQNGKLITTVAVAAGYFATARIAMLRGHDFHEEALTGAQDVAVVNEELAARFWPGQDPIGKRIRFVARTSAVEVIGLVGTVKLDTLGESPQPAIYVPLDAQKAGTVVLYVRANGDEDRVGGNRARQSAIPRARRPGLVRRAGATDRARVALPGADGRGVAQHFWRAGFAACFHRHVRRDELLREPAHAGDRHPRGFGRAAARCAAVDRPQRNEPGDHGHPGGSCLGGDSCARAFEFALRHRRLRCRGFSARGRDSDPRRACRVLAPGAARDACRSNDRSEIRIVHFSARRGVCDGRYMLKSSVTAKAWRVSALMLPVCLCCGLLAFTAPRPRQAALQSPEPAIHVTTRLVQIGVIVRDKSGPVSNLTKEDFLVLDQGKPQKISFFSLDSSAQAMQPAQPLPQNTFSDLPRDVGSAVGSITIVLLDNLNTLAASVPETYESTPYWMEDLALANGRAHLIEFIKNLNPRDRVAIYGLRESLHVLCDFTSDRSQLLAILRNYDTTLEDAPRDC